VILAFVDGIIVGRPCAPSDCDFEMRLQFCNGHLVGKSVCRQDACIFVDEERADYPNTHDVDIVFD
jgi:hypothetical protein